MQPESRARGAARLPKPSGAQAQARILETASKKFPDEGPGRGVRQDALPRESRTHNPSSSNPHPPAPSFSVTSSWLCWAETTHGLSEEQSSLQVAGWYLRKHYPQLETGGGPCIPFTGVSNPSGRRERGWFSMAAVESKVCLCKLKCTEGWGGRECTRADPQAAHRLGSHQGKRWAGGRHHPLSHPRSPAAPGHI